MGLIKVVTDSGVDLPAEIIREKDIHVVPLSVNFGSQRYVDGVDLTLEEFYAKLESEKEAASTTQPNPGNFAQVYQELVAAGHEIISIHISGSVSGTYQSATIAASMVPEGKIKVIDSRLASMGSGLLVLYAQALIEAGEDLDTIAQKVSDFREHVSTYFVVDTLEYLERNGRIGKAQALVGSLLRLKPVLTLTDGVVGPYEKVRGKGKALRRVVDIVAEQAGGPIWVAVVHGNSLAEAEKVAEEIESRCRCEKLVIAPIGGTIGVHAGPGTIGVMFCPVPQ
ncbi:MAG: DegV family protein [Limnochordia bacterium]|jgi:DegV family protein with EDD domain